MNFTFVSFAVVVSITKKVLICGSGSSVMSTVSIAFTDSAKVLEQDYKLHQLVRLLKLLLSTVIHINTNANRTWCYSLDKFVVLL